MSKPRRLEKRVTVQGASNPENVEKFTYFLSKAYSCKPVEDRGPYVSTHKRLHLPEGFDIDVIVYTNDTVFISSSPITPVAIFNGVVLKVSEIAEYSVKTIEAIRPLTLERVKDLMDFTSTLDTSDEHQRMVAVILSDTSNEIVLREQMKSLGIKGDPLEAGIPDKIRKIKEKGEGVYKEDEIKNVRELRNEIAHYGSIPTRDQAAKALEIAKDVLEHT